MNVRRFVNQFLGVVHSWQTNLDFLIRFLSLIMKLDFLVVYKSDLNKIKTRVVFVI